MNTIKILPSKIVGTHALTHLPEQIGELHDISYYERQKKNVKLEKYVPQSIPILPPSLSDIEEEIRKLGGLYNKKQSAKQVLDERKAIWQELCAFHNRIEAERESIENKKFQDKYDAIIADINDVIYGEDNAVNALLHTAIQQLKLPFELEVKIDYDKNRSIASIKAVMPLSFCIPTTKTVYHSRGFSLKNKLQRELQQEESECVIGLAMLLAGQTFSVTPNIKTVNVLFYKHRGKEALLNIFFDRNTFLANRSKMDIPSVALYEFPFAANIRTVRDAMVLGTIPEKELQAFRVATNQIP